MQPRPWKRDGRNLKTEKVPSALQGSGGVCDATGTSLLCELPAQGRKVNSGWEAGLGRKHAFNCTRHPQHPHLASYLKSL